MVNSAARPGLRWRRLGGVAVAMRSATRPGAPTLMARLGAIPRMLRSINRGDYTGTDLRHVMMMALAAGYVVSPVDLLPEGLLLMAGLADDAMVVGWLALTLIRATDDFLDWESSRDAVRGEVIG